MSNEDFIQQYIVPLFVSAAIDEKSPDQALQKVSVIHDGEIPDDLLLDLYSDICSNRDKYLPPYEKFKAHKARKAAARAAAEQPIANQDRNASSDVPPVEYAIMAGDIALAEQRIKDGADPNFRTKRGTALETALNNCNAKAARMLIEHGANFDPNAIAITHNKHKNIAQMLCKSFPEHFKADQFECLSEDSYESPWRHYANFDSIFDCTELSDITQYFEFSQEPTNEDIAIIARGLSPSETDIICNLATKNLMMAAMLAKRDGIPRATAEEHSFYARLIKEYVTNVLNERLEEAPGANDYINAVDRMLTNYC